MRRFVFQSHPFSPANRQERTWTPPTAPVDVSLRPEPWSFGIACLALVVLVSGCTVSRRRVPPEPLVELTTIPGIPRASFWGDDALPRWFDERLP